MRTNINLVDTHCHLTLDQFQTDRMQVLDRAEEAAVEIIVVPGIDLLSSRRAVELAESADGIYAAVGYHPHAADEWNDQSAGELRQLAESDSVVAIGEIGLDYHHEYCPPDLQKEVLKKQLELAAELGLPVILHNRESLGDLLPIITEWRETLPGGLRDRAGVLHAFSGTRSQGEQATKAGFYLGVGGPITFSNAEDRRQVTKGLDLKRLLVETDAPYLSPHPHRGKRNEPANTRLVAERLADLFELDLETVAGITTKNASELFGWSNGIDNSNIL